ncbi:hypothetical protein Q3G72_012639 [Acer saccharum]|nr:hypothetical protein Q3G72_012639 [Acer saccharum]
MKDADCVRKIANLYASQLQLCHSRGSVSFSLARTVHGHMISSGFKPHGHILNRLIDIYCKSSKLIYARKLFDEIPHQDIVARTTLVATYSASGDQKKAFEIFSTTPLNVRDTVFYNAMITGHSRNNDGHAAIELFRCMLRDDIRPDNFTFTSILSALSLIADDERHCMQMHCAVVKSGTGLVTSVLNALVSVYVKCASSPLVLSSSLMDAARKVFDEMPEALEIFRKMLQLRIQLDGFTYTGVISACANAGFFQLGKQVHAYLLRTEANPTLDYFLSVNNALVSFYSKCGKIDEACEIFNKMQVRDLVSWNAILSAYVSAGRIEEAKSHFNNMREKNLLTWTVMISALAQNGFGEEGLKLFSKMKLEGLEPCDYAFAGAITSCAVLGALENGRQLHGQLVRFGFEASLSTGNALITIVTHFKYSQHAICPSVLAASIQATGFDHPILNSSTRGLNGSCLLHSKRRTSQQKHEHTDSNEDDSKNLYQNVRANDKLGGWVSCKDSTCARIVGCNFVSECSFLPNLRRQHSLL